MSEYMPYLPPEEGWKKRFEITIPILLLILVFLVIAWKVGWLASIPVIGDFFKSKVTNVLVVGEDASVIMQLDTIKRDVALNYEVLKAADVDSIRDPAYVSKYNMVILTEYAYNSSDATPYLPAIFRGYLDSYMQSGRMIVIGLAGSRDPASADTNAWSVMSYVPVSCGATKPCDPNDPNIRVTNVPVADRLSLKVQNSNHPILKEFGTSLSFPTGVSSLSYYDRVNVNTGATSLLQLEDKMGAAVGAYPALVEGGGMLGGKTIYFAFHPASHPALFRNTIKYLVG